MLKTVDDKGLVLLAEWQGNLVEDLFSLLS